MLILKRFKGGPVQAFLGGASLETFSGGGQLKKSPCRSRITLITTTGVTDNAKGLSFVIERHTNVSPE